MSKKKKSAKKATKKTFEPVRRTDLSAVARRQAGPKDAAEMSKVLDAVEASWPKKDEGNAKPAVKDKGRKGAAKEAKGEAEPKDAKGAPLPAPRTARQAGKARQKPERKDGTMSGLDAAAKILAEAKEPLDCKTIVEKALADGLWKTGGKTPAATIYSAIITEIKKKGDAARFQKTDRGKFALRA